MAFDLYGQNPSSKIGLCYRINIWKWHELWNFIKFLDKSLFPDLEFWHTNDMELVDNEYVLKAYNELSSSIDDGTISKKLNNFHLQYGRMSYMSVSGYRPLSEIDIEIFCLFLKDCGGFRIG